MQLQTIIDDREFQALLTSTRQRISSLAPAMKLVGQALLESIDGTFAAEGRPTKWAELSELTLKGKSPGQKILEGDTHRLREGVHVQEVGSNYVDVAPDDLPYARIQQLGGETGPMGHRFTLKARSYLVVQAADGDRFRDIIGDYILG